MESVLEKHEADEKVVLERELHELIETTFRMEYELELLFHQTASK